MAKDAATQFKKNGKVILPQPVDITKSLEPFEILYNNSGKIVSSSGLLNGNTPQLPVGVFSDVKEKKELRFTWQPQEKTKIAAVMVLADEKGFVLAGRNLRLVEKQEDQLFYQICLVLLIGITISVIVFFTFIK